MLSFSIQLLRDYPDQTREKFMVHRLLALLFAVQILFFFGCAGESYLPRNAEFDERFVGVWSGEMAVENTDRLRRWKKKRRPDGAMILNIGLYGKGETYLGRELLTGVWWVQGKTYFEKIPGLDDLLVAHKYEVLPDGAIKFTVRTAGVDRETDYVFIETRAAKKVE